MHESVYIAGPMATSGEPGQNLHDAVDAAARLVFRGFLPYVPQMTWIMHAIQPQICAENWQKMALAWVSKCDILLRLPGESSGADWEVARATKLSKPVFYSFESLYETYRPWKGGPKKS